MMTVKELIEQLQKQDQDKEVIICVTDDRNSCWRVQQVLPYAEDIHIDCGW